ncbi:MAG: SDR family NAD(P)-dependent oxidoreductase [Actinomycetota bacterium]
MGTGEPGTRVALVTGAGGVVAEAIIQRLQAEGFLVGGLDDDGAAGDLAISVDVTDRGQTVAAAERVVRELGPISVLVTAPYLYDAAPFGEMDLDRWTRLLRTHLGGTANACAAVVPDMVRAGRGTVIALSSWLAFAGVAGEAYQAAATGSIVAFIKSFALEIAPNGVRVNCIAVGPLEATPPDASVRPAEIADTVVFLANDGDHFVGQVLQAAAGAVV